MLMVEQCLHKMKKIKQNFNLNNKVAVITGSSKGIGASIAYTYAEFGAKVIVSRRKTEDIEKVAEEIKSHGYECEAIPCHVGDSEQRKNLIEKTIEIFGVESKLSEAEASLVRIQLTKNDKCSYGFRLYQ